MLIDRGDLDGTASGTITLAFRRYRLSPRGRALLAAASTDRAPGATDSLTPCD